MVCIAAYFMVRSIYPMIKRSDVATPKPSVNDLPTMVLKELDGSSIFTKELSPDRIILILFQPDCDHCQREARQIKENIGAFADYSLYFISADSLNEINNFSITYALNDISTIHFAQADVQSILDNFGPIPAPSLYIYSAGKLIAKFNGETKIDEILNSL